MAYVRRDTGYWKYSKTQFRGYSCSICHYKFDEKKYDHIEQFNFCSECGSRLIEVRE